MCPALWMGFLWGHRGPWTPFSSWLCPQWQWCCALGGNTSAVCPAPCYSWELRSLFLSCLSQLPQEAFVDTNSGINL